MTGDKDEEVAREIETHLELEAEELMTGGMPADEARQVARRRFGNVTRTQEEVRALRPTAWLADLILDVGYALRTLIRNPVNEDIRALRTETKTLDSVDVYGPAPDMRLTGREEQRLRGARASGPLLRMLGGRPLMGRLFEPGERDPIATMDELIVNSLARPLTYAVLLGIFAGLSVALAAIGIYGVIGLCRGAIDSRDRHSRRTWCGAGSSAGARAPARQRAGTGRDRLRAGWRG